MRGMRPALPYQAPWWLPGGHVQTLYTALFAPVPHIAYRRERLNLPDGDFVDLDWVDGAADGPLLLLFHGLEGHSRGHYALSLMQAAQARGWRGVVAHFRGCSGEPNRLPRAYFAGDTGDIDILVQHVCRHASSDRIYAAGVSLGGNALLKWLGEQGAAATRQVLAAAAISAPLDLQASGNTLDQGFNRWVYTRNFLRTLKTKALAKLELHPHLFDREQVSKATTLRAFDDLVTAPLHGYRDADDYWTRASSKPGLMQIRVPTLLVNARNDPFLPAAALPTLKQVSSSVTLDFPVTGGHVGFVSGPFPGHLNWLTQRVLDFFEDAEKSSPPLRT